MGTIAENLQAIIDSKTAIKTSISNKGVSVPPEAKLNTLPALIDSIEQGGGGVSSGSPEIVDLVFINPVENAESTDIDVVVRIMSNGATANYGVQYRPVGTTNWIEGGSAVVTDNSDVKTLHGFDKIATVTLTGLLYQQSWDANLAALRENNNRYEVRAYIARTTNNYATPRIYTTGWTKYFDNIYEAANDLELGGAKKKRAIAVIHTANASTTLSQLGGDYFKTSDGYLGVSKNHIFDEAQDIPIYLEDGVNIKYYVRWVILYTNVATANITIDDVNYGNYIYCYLGNCTPALQFGSLSYSITKHIESIRFSDNTTITSFSDFSFGTCFKLKAIIVPNTITNLGSYSFSACYALTSIIFQNKNIYMGGERIFTNCYSLTSIDIDSNTAARLLGTFYGCSSLISIIIPSSVAQCAGSIFFNCSSLSYIAIPNHVTNLQETQFLSGCSSLKFINLPNSIPTIGSNAFFGCYALSVVNIPNSVTSMGDNVFQGCFSLASITIPNSVTSIGTGAFQNCYSLSSVVISNTLTRIGNNTFQNCRSLDSITIPNSVTSMGDNVFQGCFSLASITIPNSVTSIGTGAFQNCYSLSSLTLLSIPTTSTLISGTRTVRNVNIPSGWNKTINLSAGTAAYCVLTHRCILAIFNNLASGVTGLTITLGATNLARMTAEEIAIATNKGWTVN